MGEIRPSLWPMALNNEQTHIFKNVGTHTYPPPPVSKNHLAQEPTPGSAVKFSHHFFYQGSGFFMFLVDVGQLFRCAGHHFMCVTTGPPSGGTLSVTHRRTYPLNPSPLLSTPSPKQPAPDKKQTNVS